MQVGRSSSSSRPAASGRVGSATRIAAVVAWGVAAALSSGCGPREDRGACEVVVGEAVQNEGWAHVEQGAELTHAHDPPASGTHYPTWAAYQVFEDPVPRGNWIHNLEHGAVVFLFRPDAPRDSVDLLRDAYEALPDDPACGHKRALLTPDPALGAAVAVVAADAVLQGARLEVDDVLAFAQACRNHAPEDVCFGGAASF